VAAVVSASPSQRKRMEKLASQRRFVLARIVLKTGSTLVGELLMTSRIWLVAVCCCRLSARRFSRSRRLEASFLNALRAAASSGLVFALAGFARFAFRMTTRGGDRP
jgi:hypothetical protein